MSKTITLDNAQRTLLLESLRLNYARVDKRRRPEVQQRYLERIDAAYHLIACDLPPTECNHVHRSSQT